MDDFLKITSVNLIKRTQKCRITFDNEEMYNFSVDLVVKFNLVRGADINPVQLELITKEQRLIDAKQAGYNFASYKPRTEQQIRNKLSEKDFTDSEINTALNFLANFNLVDDEKYAKLFVKDYLKRKPAGAKKLQLELYKRGINKQTALSAIEEQLDSLDLESLAIKAGEKKMSLLHNKSDDKKKKALTDYLFRQCFDWEIIKSVLKHLGIH
ncbi:MAG: regulatory protein RecX [Bacteroidota bacterium]